MQYNISVFNNKRDNLPKTINIPWSDLIRRAESPHIRSVKDGPLITGTTFAHDIDTRRPRRKKDLANETSMIFGDIDHGASFDQCGEMLDGLAVTGLIYTTYSHQIVSENNPQGEDRMRICIPLATPIPAADFEPLWLWLQESMGGMLDGQAKDVSRIVYSPAKSADSAPYSYAELGAGAHSLLDWREIDLDRYRPTAPPPIQYSESNADGWEDLMSELRNRITSHPSAHRARGKVHCQGICHGGKSNSALFINAGGVVWCSNPDCDIKDILRAFGLPERPEPKLLIEHPERAQAAGLVIVSDKSQARHYAQRMECAAVALPYPIAFAGKKAVLAIFDKVASLRNAAIPVTAQMRADAKTMRGVSRLVAVLKSLQVRVEVFEVEG